MTELLRHILAILDESAVWLLLGFGLAGVVHVVLSRWRRLGALFAGSGPRPVVMAALLGLPMPLCSCSVLPAALALRREGAGRGAMASFLISVPETDIVSILVTLGLLGPAMAVYRPLAAVVTALVAGLVVGALERTAAAHAAATPAARSDEATASCCHDEAAAPAASSCCHDNEPAPAASPCCHDEAPAPTASSCCHEEAPAPTTSSCCHDEAPAPTASSCCHDEAPAPEASSCCHDEAPATGAAPVLRDAGAGPWVVRALRYGFVRMFDDIVPQLVLGFVVAAMLTAWLPGVESARAAAGSPLVYLVMLALGVPVYVCAVASTPVAVGLIAGGVSPGAALVFLLAGPATNIASLFVLRGEFGNRLLAAYLAVLGVMSLAAGVLFDRLPGTPVDVASAVAAGAHHHVSPVHRAATVVFLALFAWSVHRTRLFPRLGERIARRLRGADGRT